MKQTLIAALAALPLLLTSCVDRLGSGWGENQRWYADGHVQHRFYGRSYYYDPCSVHDAHARARGPYVTEYRTYGVDCADRVHGSVFQPYYDPNSIHDAYVRPGRGYRYIGRDGYRYPGSGDYRTTGREVRVERREMRMERRDERREGYQY